MSNQWSYIVASSVLVIAGCASLDARSPLAEQSKQAIAGQAKAELQDIHYDGYNLSGRLMIGVVEGSIRLDRRLVEEVSIRLQSVTHCEAGEAIKVLVADRFPPPASQEDLLVLSQGYWYGADVSFPLFVEEPSQAPGPDCLEVVLSLRSFDGQEAAQVSTRVHMGAEARSRPESGGGTDGGVGGDAGGESSAAGP